MTRLTFDAASRELAARAAALKGLAGNVPGKAEADIQVRVLAEGARRALSGRGAHRIQINTASAETSTLRIAGKGVNALLPGLQRQRDRSIPTIRAAMTSDIKKVVS